jgi:hypothetical protein
MIRWRIVTAALTPISAIAVAVILAALSTRSGPGATIERPASMHDGCFRDPGTNVSLPVTTQSIAVPNNDGHAPQARPLGI